MKKLIIILSILIFGPNIWAQTDGTRNNRLSLQYNDTWVGRNINLTYGYTLADHWRIYGGLKFHINSNRFRGDIVPLNYITPDEHALFYKLYAVGFAEHFGLKVGVERSVRLSATADILFFYDFQYMPKLHVEAGGGGVDDKNNVVMISPFPLRYVGQHFQEHTVGVGMSVKATERFSVRAQAGLGGATNSSPSGPLMWNGRDALATGWKFTRLVGLGIDYHLKSAKEPSSHKRKRYR